MNFIDICKSRYATKKFNATKLVSESDLDSVKEMIQLSASSFGLQPYVVRIVRDKALQAELQKASWNQEQVGTASDLLVFCANTDVASRIDEYEQMIGVETAPEYIAMMRSFASAKSQAELLEWASKQAYIAMGNVLNGAKALGFDSCPMEGFDASSYAEILDIKSPLTPIFVVPIGYGVDTPKPKVRYPLTTLFA